MDEKKRILRVIENEKQEITPPVQQSRGFSYPNQTNPISKNLSKFVNEKIGEKFSIKDLLR